MRRSPLAVAIALAISVPFAVVAQDGAARRDAPVQAVDAAPPAAAAARLAGRVVNAATHAPIANATLIVNGRAHRADATGAFRIDTRAGVATIHVSADGYASELLEAFELAPGPTDRDFALAPEGMAPARGPLATEDVSTLEGVTVEGTVRTDDQAAFVEERRASASVTEVLSAEQIARSGDSDAATALRRVTGLTLVNDRFVYVRGLGERYSSVLLNGAQIPSPDPTRRVVPLDLFPTGIIEGMVVQKSYSADMPGEFGGGTVMLRTKRFPESFYAKLSGTLGYAHGTTFEDGLGYDGGGRDWTGRDDGTRGLPSALAAELDANGFLRQQSPLVPDGATAAEIEGYGEAITGVFDVERDSIGPDTGFAGAIGNAWSFGDGNRGGFLASVRYAQEWDDRDEFRQTFIASDAGLERQDFFDVERTIRTIDGSAFLTAGLEFGGNHFLKYTGMLLRQTEDETRVSTGTEVNEEAVLTELEWIENSLLANQLGGEHWFPGARDLRFEWMLTTSKAEREVPDKRRYRYDVVVDAAGEHLEFSQRADNLQIVHERLEDDSDTLDLELGLPLALSDSVTMQLAAGASFLERDRDSRIRRFGFQSPQPGSGVPPEVFRLPSLEDILADGNIFPTGFRLFEATRPTDNYFAGQELDAYFLSAELAFADKARATVGARHESNVQQVTTFSIGSATATPVVSTIDEDELLPAVNFTWFASPDSQVRASYAETLSRPDFRELSPAPYTDPEQDAEVLGNPDLVTTNVRNYDLRYEHYFSPSESFSAGLFLKEFDDPIEVLRIPVATVLLTLDNAREARNYGFELDWFSSLAILEEGGWGEKLGVGDWLDWENFYFGLNYAYIESEVTLAPGSGQTNEERPLQGQSPYVANLQLGYLSPDGEREVTASFNRFGERIAQVGIAGAPDILEQPANSLDLVWQEQLSEDWRLRLRARNLLDPAIEYTQGGQTTREFRRGRELHATLEWSPQ